MLYNTKTGQERERERERELENPNRRRFFPASTPPEARFFPLISFFPLPLTTPLPLFEMHMVSGLFSSSDLRFGCLMLVTGGSWASGVMAS